MRRGEGVSGWSNGLKNLSREVASYVWLVGRDAIYAAGPLTSRRRMLLVEVFLETDEFLTIDL